jgi:hypothetical protein
MRNKSSKIWDSSLINNSLSEFFSVLGNLSKGSGRDSLKSKLWLLNTENEEANSSSINNSLSKLVVVFGDARKSECSSFFN